MKLYNNVGRIFNELKEIGKDKSKILKVEDLIKFDQLHYCGIDAVDFAIINTKINSSKSILEIGSGIGGPARYIGYKTRASVTALELQADHHKIALDLTKKCKLLKNVNHIRGDILNYNWKNKKFDVIFIDPPFRKNLVEQTAVALNQNKLAENAMIYVEMEVESQQQLPSNWQLLKEKKAGQVIYQLYQHLK